jgi:hypothetical protein
VSASSFAWSSVNPLPTPLKCFVRPLENILQAGQWFLSGVHVSRPVECQLKMTNIQGEQAPAKWQEMLKNSRIHLWRPSLNNPWILRHRWDQLWSLPGDLNRKSEHASHCSFIMAMCLHTHSWKPRSLWLTIAWLSFPILPTSWT